VKDENRKEATMMDLIVSEKSLQELVGKLSDVETRLRSKFGFKTAVRLKVVVYDIDGSFLKEELVGEWDCSLATWMGRFMQKSNK
jgi:hypothetical protein